MSATNCSSDFDDCGPTQLCFRDVSWLPAGVESECGCSTYFGWQGAHCDVIGVKVAFNIAIVLAILGLALVAFGYNVRALRRFLRLRAPGDRRWDPSTLTVVFVLLSLLSIVLWRFFTLATLYTPQLNDFSLRTSDLKLHRLAPAEKSFLGLASVFGMLALLNVAVVWIDIARKSARMANTDASLWGGFARYVTAFQLAFFLSILVSTLYASTELAALLSLPFQLAIGAVYVVGRRRLSALLRIMGADLAAFNASPAASPAAAAAAAAATAALRKSRAVPPGASPLRLQESGDDLESADWDGDDSKESALHAQDSTASGGPAAGDRSSMIVTALSSVGRAATKTLNRVRTRSLDKAVKRQRELEERNEYFKLLTKVRNTAFFVFVNGCALLVATAVYAATGLFVGPRELCTPDETFCVVTLSLEFVALFLLGAVTAVSHYVYDNARVRKQRHRKLSMASPRTTGGDSTSTDRRSLQRRSRPSSPRGSGAPPQPPSASPKTSFFDGDAAGGRRSARNTGLVAPLRRLDGGDEEEDDVDGVSL